jgi:hypothetical protein
MVSNPSRGLAADDIIDIQLAVLTNGQVTTDKAGHHLDLSTLFPYLGFTTSNHVVTLFPSRYIDMTKYVLLKEYDWSV